MKPRNMDLPIHTLPKGSYEGGALNTEQDKKKTAAKEEIVKDAQGNGYQVNDKKK